MAEIKRPRRTRERILETSLALFNELGEPHVTTADIADEMNISPGNLYYHFRNKDELIAELYAAHEAQVLPLFAAQPHGRFRDTNVEDLWLLLHLLFERIREYRFLYRDLDELTSRNRRLSVRFSALLRRGASTVVELCRGMAAAGSMRASEPEIAAVAQNIVLIVTYWMSFQRLTRVGRESAEEIDLGRAAYQVLALVSPYLVGDARALVDRLGADYLSRSSHG
jgi:AcrR family transcriptional regulator